VFSTDDFRPMRSSNMGHSPRKSDRYRKTLIAPLMFHHIHRSHSSAEASTETITPSSTVMVMDAPVAVHALRYVTAPQSLLIRRIWLRCPSYIYSTEAAYLGRYILLIALLGMEKFQQCIRSRVRRWPDERYAQVKSERR
jgi:hypothetical protein